MAGSLAVGVSFSLAQGYLNDPGIGDLIVFAALLVVLLVFRSGKATALDTVSEF